MAVNGGAGTPAVPPLDPGLLRVIRASAVQLGRLEDEFVRQLQYDLATLIPDLPGLRTTDGWVFCQRMVRVLLWAAITDQPGAVIASALRQVGAANWLEGFPEAQYVSVAHGLVRTVRDLNSDEWSTSQGSAWISFFQWARPYLMSGAHQAAAERAAAQQAAAAERAAAERAGVQRAAAPQPEWPQAPGPEPSRPRDLRVVRPKPAPGDVDLEQVAGLLGDEDEEDGEGEAGYGQIMVSMTRNPRRERPGHPA